MAWGEISSRTRTRRYHKTRLRASGPSAVEAGALTEYGDEAGGDGRLHLPIRLTGIRAPVTLTRSLRIRGMLSFRPVTLSTPTPFICPAASPSDPSLFPPTLAYSPPSEAPLAYSCQTRALPSSTPPLAIAHSPPAHLPSAHRPRLRRASRTCPTPLCQSARRWPSRPSRACAALRRSSLPTSGRRSAPVACSVARSLRSRSWRRARR